MRIGIFHARINGEISNTNLQVHLAKASVPRVIVHAVTIKAEIGRGDILVQSNWTLVVCGARSIDSSLGAIDAQVGRGVKRYERVQQIPLGRIPRLCEGTRRNEK
jgi:hypothetical protein